MNFPALKLTQAAHSDSPWLHGDDGGHGHPVAQQLGRQLGGDRLGLEKVVVAGLGGVFFLAQSNTGWRDEKVKSKKKKTETAGLTQNAGLPGLAQATQLSNPLTVHFFFLPKLLQSLNC